MIILDSTVTLEAILGGAVASLESNILASFQNVISTGDTFGKQSSVTTSGTAVTVVAAPSSGNQILLLSLQLKNLDTAAITVTFRLNASGTLTSLFKATLPIGATMSYEDGIGWRVFDPTGSVPLQEFTLPSGTLLKASWISNTTTATPLENGTKAVSVELVGSSGASGSIATGTTSNGAALGGAAGGNYSRMYVATSGTSLTNTAASPASAGVVDGSDGSSGGSSFITIAGTNYSADHGAGGYGTNTQARSTSASIWRGRARTALGTTNCDFSAEGMPGTPGYLLSIATTSAGGVSGIGGMAYGGSGNAVNTNSTGQAASLDGSPGGAREIAATTGSANLAGGTGHIMILQYS